MNCLNSNIVFREMKQNRILYGAKKARRIVCFLRAKLTEVQAPVFSIRLFPFHCP